MPSLRHRLVLSAFVLVVVSCRKPEPEPELGPAMCDGIAQSSTCRDFSSSTERVKRSCESDGRSFKAGATCPANGLIGTCALGAIARKRYYANERVSSWKLDDARRDCEVDTKGGTFTAAPQP
jgi:hypothetical protein